MVMIVVKDGCTVRLQGCCPRLRERALLLLLILLLLLVTSGDREPVPLGQRGLSGAMVRLYQNHCG